MNKLSIFLFCLFLTITTSVLAQDDDDEPLPPPHGHSQTKIGGAGGFTQNFLFLDFSPINQFLRNNNAAPFNQSPIVMLGGQGYGYILVLQNVRIGGIGASGSVTSKSLDALGIERDVNLSVGYGGVTIDYVYPVMSRVDVTAGIVLGTGSMNIKMTRDDGSAKTWDGIWNTTNGFGSNQPISNYSSTLSGSFFMYQPNINVEVAVLRWLGLRVGVSYNGLAGGSWKVDDQYDLFGVPDNINGKGFMINGGIFLGTFIF